MTIVANKHVARVGHEFAAAMTADTPIIEIAKMVSHLATALDKQTELTAQLAMENTILLTPENWLKHSEEGAAASAIAEGNGASEVEALLAGMKSIIACMQSLATSAAIAALREEARADAFSYAADSVRHEIICLKERSPTLKEMACLANEFDSMARHPILLRLETTTL
ncbi:MAG: hypothetical protein E6325_21650 [Enterobacteriaceae bacterium]|nr:hypothetical protein [Enterobacteriaceae bacterium]